MPSTSYAMLRAVQRELMSDVPTDSLLFPEGVSRDVVFGLEAARLIINRRGWLPHQLHPLLAASTDPKTMWKPAALAQAFMDAGAPATVLIFEYLGNYAIIHQHFAAPGY